MKKLTPGQIRVLLHVIRYYRRNHDVSPDEDQSLTLTEEKLEDGLMTSRIHVRNRMKRRRGHDTTNVQGA